MTRNVSSLTSNAVMMSGLKGSVLLNQNRVPFKYIAPPRQLYGGILSMILHELEGAPTVITAALTGVANLKKS